VDRLKIAFWTSPAGERRKEEMRAEVTYILPIRTSVIAADMGVMSAMNLPAAAVSGLEILCRVTYPM
jgi:hypothetical protein